MAKLAIVILLSALALSGCTRVSYEPDKNRIVYFSLMQEKNLEITTPDGKRFKYSTNSDPVVEALEAGIAAGERKAMGAAL